MKRLQGISRTIAWCKTRLALSCKSTTSPLQAWPLSLCRKDWDGVVGPRHDVLGALHGKNDETPQADAARRGNSLRLRIHDVLDLVPGIARSFAMTHVDLI